MSFMAGSVAPVAIKSEYERTTEATTLERLPDHGPAWSSAALHEAVRQAKAA
jgi:hypothetical protein